MLFSLTKSCLTLCSTIDCSLPVCYSMSGCNCCFLTCIQVSQEAGKAVWCSHLFKKSPQFVVIHRVKSFSAVNDEDIFLKFPCFLYDPKDLELSSVVPLPFLNQLEHLEVLISHTVEA